MITVLIVVAAALFDFVNGFHDSSNSIAGLVATRTLKPRHAVLWAAFFNVVAVFVFGTAVARMVGSGMVALDAVTPPVILAGLLGAIAWGLITWWKGIPTSSTHALLGGYAGAAMAHAAMTKGAGAIGSAIIPEGWELTLLFIVVAPALGLVLALGLMKVALALDTTWSTEKTGRFFGPAQMFSSAFLSLMHGANDAQKTAGIIAGALVAGGYFQEFTIPAWVLALSYGMMGLGTFMGGWRIVRTLGHDLTRLKPDGGFCSSAAAALSILMATLFGLPVSTTHVTTGAILGTGAARNQRAVRWMLAGRIVWAWILTIPAAGIIGAGVALLFTKVIGL